MSANTPPSSTPPVLRNRTINPAQVSPTYASSFFCPFNVLPLKNKDVTTSPSSTTISDSGVSTSFRHTDDLAVRVHASAGFLASRKMTIRPDPALLTCFDAADKQLYDLWVPRT